MSRTAQSNCQACLHESLEEKGRGKERESHLMKGEGRDGEKELLRLISSSREREETKEEKNALDDCI